MTLRDLLEQIKDMDDKFLDAEVCVDVEARNFDCHLVDARNICPLDEKYLGTNLVIINI